MIGAVQELPTGTVTFLFTDIEGSTRLLREQGDIYADMLAEHSRVMREAFARYGGVEVAVQGDAFVVAFAQARDGVAAAQAAQTALAGGPIRVRMGLHTGEPVVTKDGYLGIDLNRAARVAAAGHGGQTLLTGTTRDLVGADVRDLGFHRLKDLGAPEQIFQLGQETFPPLRSLNHTNLPVQPTPFHGRTRELREVLDLLRGDSGRLLTLTGAGGTGKTRLAVQAAVVIAHELEYGVFFVDLAPLRDPELVLPTIEQALGAEADLAAHIGGKSMLLLLDNFEQLIGAAPVLSKLLLSCPNLLMLVTSREPLHLAAEQEYPVPPLASEEAVNLFDIRARAVRPDFQASEAIPEICRHLDNLPLALELAAARVKVLSPETILRRLEHRLPLLTGGAHDLPERQRTLRSTIAWSFDLLEPEEQHLFACLSVFSGGCTLEAAEGVCGAELDTLQSLVDKSLLRLNAERFSMLETIHEFALERLEESGETERLQRAHRQYFLAFAQEASSGIFGSGQQALLECLEVEHDNFRSVLAGSLERREHATGLALAAALEHFWLIRDYVIEGRRWLRMLLAAAPGTITLERADALKAAGGMEQFAGDEARAAELYEQSLAQYQQLGAKQRIAAALSRLGRYEESLTLAREISDDEQVAVCLHALGEQERERGHHDRAEWLLGEALTFFRRQGDAWTEAATLGGLGDLDFDRHRYDSAAARYRQSVVILHQLGAKRAVGYSLAGLAAVAAVLGDVERAGRLWAALVTLEAEIGVSLTASERRRYEAAIDGVAEDGRFRAAADEGRRLSLNQALEYALDRNDRGGVQAHRLHDR